MSSLPNARSLVPDASCSRRCPRACSAALREARTPRRRPHHRGRRAYVSRGRPGPARLGPLRSSRLCVPAGAQAEGRTANRARRRPRARAASRVSPSASVVPSSSGTGQGATTPWAGGQRRPGDKRRDGNFEKGRRRPVTAAQPALGGRRGSLRRVAFPRRRPWTPGRSPLMSGDGPRLQIGRGPTGFGRRSPARRTIPRHRPSVIGQPPSLHPHRVSGRHRMTTRLPRRRAHL